MNRAEPFEHTLEFSRVEAGDDPYAFQFRLQTYQRREPDGSMRVAKLEWNQLRDDLEALQGTQIDPEVIRRLGHRLGDFLRRSGWDRYERELALAARELRPIRLTIRSSATELYSLPWELATLEASGQPLAALPDCLVRYEWPDEGTRPPERDPRVEGGRILFVWSEAGGSVPHSEHLDALRKACKEGYIDFDPESDVLEDVSSRALFARLKEASQEEKPYSILHVLCHGDRLTGDRDLFGLIWCGASVRKAQAIDGITLGGLLAPHASTLRLVVLCACLGGDAGDPGNPIGGVAQGVHRAGLEAVVASRFPLSKRGSALFTTTFYTRLLVDPSSVETAFLAAREALGADTAKLDACSIQLYGRADGGFDTRPVVFVPYRGLLAFERRHERFFFGREGKDPKGRDREVDELLSDFDKLVSTPGSPRLAVVAGDSGTGKSSMVFASAVPHLERKGWVWQGMRPGSAPLAALDEALEALDEKMAKQRVTGRAARSLLIVDQLEELFTSVAKGEEQTGFVRRLWERASQSGETCPSVIVTIRIDFLGRCGDIVLDRESGLRLDKVACDPAHQILVAQMDSEQLREAIEKPAARVGLLLEPGLTKRILEGVDREPGALPLVQHTLQLMWKKRRGRTLTQASYDELGGVGGALNQHADGVFDAFDEEKQRLARRLLMGLVRLGRGDAPDTRQREPLLRLRPVGGEDAARFDQVVSELVDQRLLVRSGSEGREQTVEVAHEALIRKWERLGKWISRERAWLLALEQVESWVETYKEFRTLLTEGQLEVAEQALGAFPERPLIAARELAKKSRAELERRRWRARALAMAAGLAAVIMGALAFLAWSQATAANRATQEAREQAVKARKEALMASVRELQVRNQFAPMSRLLLEVKDPENTRGWTELAVEMLQAGTPTFTQRDHKGPVTTAAWSPDGKRIVTASFRHTAWVSVWNADGSGIPVLLEGHQEGVTSASWSPDGKRIVTASSDRTARVWNADGSGAPVILKGHESPVTTAAWSPDGKRVVTASSDTARVWNADGSGTPVMLKGHEGPVTTAAWSPDGKRVVTASGEIRKSMDKTARVWNADGLGTPVILEGHEEGVFSAAWSPDGKRIVTASRDKTARVWDSDGSGTPGLLKGHDGPIWSAAWSPDSQRIVTASEDKTARVWNADGSRAPVLLKGHQEGVSSAVWSPDGKRVITASLETAWVWSADGSGTPVLLKGHEKGIRAASWSSDGKRIVTASDDLTARIWNADGSGTPVLLRGHEGPVVSSAWSPDGKRIVTASDDETARVWDSDGSGTPVLLEGHEEGVFSAAWSPDGKRIVTASLDKTARVWSADGSGPPLVLEGHQEGVYLASWSPDGRRIVTASSDRTARVWNADSGTSVVLKGHEEMVYFASWSPDGRRIATASSDRTARVWNADGSEVPLILAGHEGPVTSAVWSPDGKRIVTVSLDKMARVWSADGSGTPVLLKGHEERVYFASWSPDGRRIVTASHDRTARVWTVDVPTLQRLLLEATTDCLAPQEHQTYLDENPGEAQKAYEACERSHGRIHHVAVP